MTTVMPFPVGARPLLEVRSLSQVYQLRRQRLLEPRPTLKVLQEIDFSVRPGESVGLVGESGSGKTTLTRMLTGVERPTEGQVLYDGINIWEGDEAHRRTFRRSVQVVLQNPRSSLDPRMRVGTSLLEPLRSLKVERQARTGSARPGRSWAEHARAFPA
jgi:ABC-type glutathione transport system ATPase component